MRFFTLTFLFLLMVAPRLRADRTDDLVAIHLEVMGGRQRIDALTALRATGQVIAAGKRVGFTMVAARPDRVRIETEGGGRTLVQATDGVEPPWEFDTGTWPPLYRPMADAAAKTFVGDAEFDDPLVAGAARGYVFDFGGEIEVDGRKLLRILVTRKLTETSMLLVDDETYFIVKRIEERTTASGRKVSVITHYADFRPVEGVLLPHLLTLTIEGQVVQQTKIEKIEANPKVSEETFTRPKVVLPVAPKP